MLEQEKAPRPNRPEVMVEKWKRNFCNYLEIDSSDVNTWLLEGVHRGICDNTSHGRKNLATEIGAVFAFVFDELTGAEKVIEDLDLDEISKGTGIELNRVEVLGHFMVEVGIISSRKLLEARKREKHRFDTGRIR